LVDQLQATAITGDGAWVYADSAIGKFTALVAWWYGGVLRNLALLHVPDAENRNDLFKEQLNQMSWAGELEGWLTAAPQWHLVADDATAGCHEIIAEAGARADRVCAGLSRADRAGAGSDCARDRDPAAAKAGTAQSRRNAGAVRRRPAGLPRRGAGN